MKKYIILLSAALLAIAGCAKFEHETPTARVYVDAPVITKTALSDHSFSVTITPAAGTAYYSYALVAGQAASVDSIKVFKTTLTGSLDKGTVKYSEAQSLELTYDEMDSKTYYTIYAASSSEQGSVGSVSSLTLFTSDTEVPEIEDYDASGSVVMITFSDAVEYDESALVEVAYYAVNDDNYAEVEGFNWPLKTAYGYGSAEVSVNGKIATITLSDVPVGAYYTISFPEGTFYDSFDNPCPAVDSYCFDRREDAGTDYAYDWYYGIYGQNPNEDFELSIYGDEEGEGVSVISTMSDPIWIAVPDDFIYYAYDADATGTIVYETEEEGHSSVDTYEIGYGYPSYGFGWNGTYNCALSYPNAGEYYTGRPDPARGSYVTITIPAFLEDIYGNENAEFVIGPFLYSYGFTLDDVVGTYDYAGATVFSGKADEPCTWVIAESDDPDQGNVMFTSIFGYDDVKVYADFDGDCGTLSIVTDAESNYIDTVVYPDTEYGYVTYELYTWAYYGDLTTFSMTASHTFTDVDDYIGYIYYAYASDADGNYTEDDYLSYGYNMFYALPEYVESNSVAKAPKAFNAGARPLHANVPGKSLVKDTPKVSLK